MFAAAIWPVEIGYADLLARSPRADAVSRAVRLAPGDAAYRARWSLMTDDGAVRERELRTTVKLNPYYSWAWIQLGLAAEARGDLDQAERLLLRAAAVDRRFKPAWVLCDYYFRHGPEERFWDWSRQALAVNETDSRPLFRLAWRMAPDSRVISQRLIPPTPRARQDFLAWLLAERPARDSVPAAHLVLDKATPADTALLLQAVEKLIDEAEGEPAVELWNELCNRHAIPFQPILPDRSLLTNAAFTTKPSGRGFDWCWNPTHGVTAADDGEAGKLKLHFSGDEPEECRLLTQKVPVVPGRRYTLRYAGLAGGLRWRLMAGDSGPVVAESAVDGSPLDFTAPRQSILTLVLEYQRPRGSSRLSGAVSIGGLDLRPVAEAH